MPVLPEGELSIKLDLLEKAILASETFANQCALEGLEPSEQIFWHSLRPEFEGNVIKPTPLTRPFVVMKIDQIRLNLLSDRCLAPRSNPRIHINDKYRSTNFKDSSIEFTNFVGKLLEDIWNYTADGNESLEIQQIFQTTDPTATKRKEHGTDHEFWFAEYEIQCGAEFSG